MAASSQTRQKSQAPLYYSITKEETRPKYNPLDTDLLLDESLDAMGDTHERDSVERIAVTKTTNTNFSLSNVRVGIQTKRHPMPYDPANFSFSYSHNHSYSSGETTVYEREDNWRGALNYSYTPVYKPFEPFKKLIKNKSKWFDILKRFGLNWMPQNITFDTEMTRNYYELQERDMESTEGNMLPLTFSEQFLWNRSFSVRWDLTKNLHMNFSSATNAEIETPYTPVNKDLYPDRYSAWKDSVWTSIKDFGRPLDYNQTFTASYQLPLNLIPIFDWVNADGNYNTTYNWARGTELEDGTSLGNSVTMNRMLNVNGTFNLERLYNHIPFLKKTNDRFNKTARRQSRNIRGNRNRQNARTARNGSKNDKDSEKEKKILPKNKRSFREGDSAQARHHAARFPRQEEPPANGDRQNQGRQDVPPEIQEGGRQPHSHHQQGGHGHHAEAHRHAEGSAGRHQVVQGGAVRGARTDAGAQREPVLPQPVQHVPAWLHA